MVTKPGCSARITLNSPALNGVTPSTFVLRALLLPGLSAAMSLNIRSICSREQVKLRFEQDRAAYGRRADSGPDDYSGNFEPGHRALARGWWGEGDADEVSGVDREGAERGTPAIPAQALAGG
jgi:hypothetical protein